MLTFVDIFAGTGGIRLGLEQACSTLSIDSKCVYSSEINASACLSYKNNFGENPYADITTETFFPEFDLLLAGFPCQPFSYAGKQEGFNDTRGTLFFHVERILQQKKPTYFFLENVRGLLTHDKGRTFLVIQTALEKLGYRTQYVVLNSSAFGVPQNRVRLYLVGVLGTTPKMTLKTALGPSDTHKGKTLIQDGVTVASILEPTVHEKYLCTPEFAERLRCVVGTNFELLHGYRLTDYRGGKSIHSWDLGLKGECSPKEVHFMNALIANRRKKLFGAHQDGKSLTKEQIQTFYTLKGFDTISESLQQKGYLSCKEGLYNPVCGNMSFEVFKFLDPDGIAITLTASDANRLGIVQNNVPRRLTPRECARLQGFPDTYSLLENDREMYKQFGNAVSVPVVRAVLLDFLQNNLPL